MFADGFVFSSLQHQLLHLANLLLPQPSEQLLRQLGVCLAVVLVRREYHHCSQFLMKPSNLVHAFALDSSCTWSIFWSSNSWCVDFGDLYEFCLHLQFPLIFFRRQLSAPAFGQPAPAPAFGATPAPATGGLFGSAPGTDLFSSQLFLSLFFFLPTQLISLVV